MGLLKSAFFLTVCVFGSHCRTLAVKFTFSTLRHSSYGQRCVNHERGYAIPLFGHIPMFAFSSLMLKRSVKLLNNIKFAIITFSSSLLFFSLFFSSSSFYFFRRGSYTHTHTHTHTHTVNKLVFYAQSTGTVISGRRERERGERERELQRKTSWL